MTRDGVSSRPVESLLTERAREYLARGPADAVPLIEHVCQMPGAPPVVAQQMALALFADRPEFARDAAGRWHLADAPAALRPTSGPPAENTRGRDELGALSYVVVDVETTGMQPAAGDRITEIAAVVVRDGAVADRFETLINPERPIPPMITALTHISWSMVKDAPRFRDVCGELLRFLEGHVFVAHNAEFDWRFVSAEVTRATGRRLTGRRLCTVRLARRVLPHLPSRRLDSLARHYDVDIAARHRAGGDAAATATILLRLLDEARARDCRSWTDLQALVRGERPGASPRPPRRGAMPRPTRDDGSA